jgi:CRISPR-associated protein Cas2
MIYRFMRLLVLFDLPVKRKAERKRATQFRNFLLRDGYDMVQWSVYSRICPTQDSVRTHLKRLKMAAPEHGAVRIITLTNKQYADAHIVTGTRTPQEKRVNEQQMMLF